MIQATLPHRGHDKHGSGAWGAPRGARTHQGVDYAAYPGTRLYSPVAGYVTRVGYPYADDLSYRYVQITDEREADHRFFYVSPCVQLGSRVLRGDEIGVVQDLDRRYRGIVNHVHVEIRRDGNYLNPDLELR